MELTRELFVIPQQDDQFVLYAPLEGSVLQVNSGTIDLLRRIKSGEIPETNLSIERLRELNILKDNEGQVETSQKENQSYAPTETTLVPTFDCNLRCIYCYARAGEDIGKPMSFEIAKAAIDLITKNAKTSDLQNTSLGFHGGGEPFLEENFKLIQRIVDYYQQITLKEGLKPRVSGVTNGVLGRNQLEWLVSNFDGLGISIDGPEDIQNSQRPSANGKPSYPAVKGTIDYLESQGFPYGIRSTITAGSVESLPEIVQFFSSISSCETFHLEPLFECGRCRTTKSKSPDPEKFFEYFLKAQEVEESLNVKIVGSGARSDQVTTTFCSATKSNFFVTPEGDVTTCFEACRKSDSGSKVFFIGSYDQGKFEFNQGAIQNLRGRTVDNLPHCSDCFAKYSCAGDCLAKTYQESGDAFDTSNNGRCYTNRKFLIDQLTKKLKGGNKK